jgi:hypothetical protein
MRRDWVAVGVYLFGLLWWTAFVVMIVCHLVRAEQ